MPEEEESKGKGKEKAEVVEQASKSKETAQKKGKGKAAPKRGPGTANNGGTSKKKRRKESSDDEDDEEFKVYLSLLSPPLLIPLFLTLPHLAIILLTKQNSAGSTAEERETRRRRENRGERRSCKLSMWTTGGTAPEGIVGVLRSVLYLDVCCVHWISSFQYVSSLLSTFFSSLPLCISGFISSLFHSFLVFNLSFVGKKLNTPFLCPKCDVVEVDVTPMEEDMIDARGTLIVCPLAISYFVSSLCFFFLLPFSLFCLPWCEE